MDTRMEMVDLPLHLIDEDKDQPRNQFDDEAIQELMNSIAELGLLSPIKVRKLDNGRYKIIYGNRRYKASKNLGRSTIPCIVSNVTDELEIYLEQIAENLTREGFTPVEEAEAFHKLMNDPKFSSSTKFLSSKLGKPEAYIKNKLDLLKFDAKVRKLVVSGTEIRKDKLTEDQLLPLKDLPMEHRDSLALIVARDELPVNDVKRLAKLFKSPDISDGTKDKLLYKSGYELLQTWSTYEANRKERAERARRAAEKLTAAAAAHAPNEAATNAVSPTSAVTAAPNEAATAAPNAASTAIAAPNAATVDSGASLHPNPLDAIASAVEISLRQLLASLPEAMLSQHPHELAHALRELNDSPRLNQLVNDINHVIPQLESHLDAWRTIVEQLSPKL